MKGRTVNCSILFKMNTIKSQTISGNIKCIKTKNKVKRICKENYNFAVIVLRFRLLKFDQCISFYYYNVVMIIVFQL